MTGFHIDLYFGIYITLDFILNILSYLSKIVATKGQFSNVIIKLNMDA